MTWHGKTAKVVLSLHRSQQLHFSSSAKQAPDMGPKNSTATCASALPPRDLSWIDRMYMKFETMCVEVDKNPSLLLQETSKYVESQVNAVGVNVKKLCTELIQDLISTPMLSPEGVDKKLECALHCKCHCMDLEKPKLIGTDAAGIDNGDDTFDNTVYQKEDMMKEEGSQVEMPNIVEKGGSKVEVKNIDVAREPQNPKIFEVCGPDLNNTHGKDDINKGRKLSTLIRQLEIEDIGGYKSCEEELDLAKGFKSVQQEEFKGNCKSTVAGENKSTSEVSVRGIMETAVSRSEAVFAEHTSRLKADDNKERVGANVSNATYVKGYTNTFLGSQNDKLKPEFLQEMRARSAEDLCKRPVSDADFPNVLIGERELLLNTHACYAKSTLIAEDLQAEEVKDSIRTDGSFQSLCTYDLKDDEPITMSEFFNKEDVHDEEQSAHWFVGEDLRKALQPDIFSVEKSRYGESFVNEFDLDWELL
ncbi:hypothetical protein GOP47_0020494 [Adiantum capillus-veneris]|uniref:Uncharacterized protein n=1 Tax=Adiantum capillus-veneris TaxID=13818 RepID=A0A9D4UAW4_ADICA|nr:hypothetical protein GOP47_0020494 [Adiantum capillus-veneris]